MTIITCKRCGLSFETEATTNTRCRSCRAVVRVPAAARNLNGSRTDGSAREHTIAVVLLGCGHPDIVVIHPGRSIAATLKRYEWECPDTSTATAVAGVLAVLSEAQYESMTDEDLDVLGAAS
jgi:hypothetical protein